jgi:hypothetical protein
VRSSAGFSRSSCVTSDGGGSKWNGYDYVEHFEEPKPLDWLGYGSLVGMATPPTELRGTVAAGTISLKTPAGAMAVNVAAGRYVIVVLDRSRRDNFHLSGNGVNRRTG